MIGLVRNEWKKVFLPVLLTTVLLAIAMSVFLFSEKMDWGRFDCSHSDGCSNWGNSSVWYRITFAGHGTGYFQVLPFLELLITGGVPLYLLAAFVEQTVNGQY